MKESAIGYDPVKLDREMGRCYTTTSSKRGITNAV